MLALEVHVAFHARLSSDRSRLICNWDADGVLMLQLISCISNSQRIFEACNHSEWTIKIINVILSCINSYSLLIFILDNNLYII